MPANKNVLAIRLLGDMELRWQTRSLPLPHRTARRLLVYLCLHPGRIHRAELATQLCSAESDMQARNQLRQAIFQLARILPAKSSPFLHKGDWLEWRQDEQQAIDLSQFLTADLQDIESCSRAIALYRGEFLASEGLHDDSPFAIWAEQVRGLAEHRLQQIYQALIDLYLADSNSEMALDWATRWTQKFPLLDLAHLRLMQILAAAGQTQQALYVFEQFRNAKATMRGEKPETTLRSLYEELQELQTISIAPKIDSNIPGSIAITVLAIFPGPDWENASDKEIQAHIQKYHEVAHQIAGQVSARDRVAGDGVLELIFDGEKVAAEGPLAAVRAMAALRKACPEEDGAIILIDYGQILLNNAGEPVGQLFRSLRQSARNLPAGARMAVGQAAYVLLPNPCPPFVFETLDQESAALSLCTYTEDTSPDLNAFIAHSKIHREIVHRIRAVLDGHPGECLWVVGPPGIGKTWLFQQVLQPFDGQVPVIRYQASAAHSNQPLYPMAQTLRRLLRLEGLEKPVARHLLQQHLQTLGEADPILLRIWFHWLEVSSEPEDTQPVLQEFRHLLEESALQLLAQISPGPHIVVVEDLHWADASSIALLERYIQRLPHLPVLMLINSRGPLPGFADPATTFPLHPLSDQEGVRLLQTLLPVAVPTDQLQAFYRASTGIPLYLDSIARNHDLFLHKDLQNHAGALDIILQAQIERNRDCVETLEAATIIGNGLTSDEVVQLSEQISKQQAEFQLEQLRSRGILEKSDETWSFRHDLLQRASRIRMHPEQVQRMHLRWAQHLSHRAAHSPALIAQHFLDGGDALSAGRFFARASRAALELGAYREALANSEKSLSCLEDIPTERYAPQCDYYFATRALYGYSSERVLFSANALEELSETLGHRGWPLLGLRFGQWVTVSSQYSSREAMLAARRIIDTQYNEVPREAVLSLGHYALGWTEFYQNHLSVAQSYLRSSLDHWREEWIDQLQLVTGEITQVAALGYLGVIDIMQNDMSSGLARIDRAEKLASPDYNLYMWLFIKVMRAAMGIWTDDSADTLYHCEIILRVNAAHRLQPWQDFICAIKAWAEARQGRRSAEASLRQIRQHIRAVERSWRFGASVLFLFLTDIAVRSKHPQVAAISYHAERHIRRHAALSLLPRFRQLHRTERRRPI
ncbi:MAG: AAA family ATPase [Acidithiobacillus sp.]|nr:AAA family ATPase [Acidithiobacillus sp.]